MNITQRVRNSNVTAIVLVASMLLIDFMLLTAIVPVIPPFLWKLHLRNLKENNGGNNRNISYTTQKHNFHSSAVFYNVTTTNISESSLKAKESAYLATQSVQISAIIAAKPAVQIVANFINGPLIDKVGSSIPMFFGIIVICTTATVFAIGESYPALLCSAALQGIGSGCLMTGGMSMLAKKFSDDDKRARAIAMTLGIVGLGTIVGPPYGSVMYTFFGKTVTFLVLAGMIAIIGGIQVWYSRLKIDKNNPEKQATSVFSMFSLLKDPCIILGILTIFLGSTVFGILDSGFTTWLIQKFNASKWLTGIAFIPVSVSYILIMNLVHLIPAKNFRWTYGIIGMLVMCIGCVTLPFAVNVPTTVGSTLIIGLGAGLADAIMYPTLATLVDNRHEQAYGSVYALADMSICLGLVLGPLFTGVVVKALSFQWVMWILSIALFLFSPALILLKNVEKTNEETASLLNNPN